MGNVLNMQPQFRPCTGCGACMLSCPNNYITMGINSEGFIRPTINDSCTQCGLCTETCIKFMFNKNTVENHLYVKEY